MIFCLSYNKLWSFLSCSLFVKMSKLLLRLNPGKTLFLLHSKLFCSVILITGKALLYDVFDLRSLSSSSENCHMTSVTLNLIDVYAISLSPASPDQGETSCFWFCGLCDSW